MILLDILFLLFEILLSIACLIIAFVAAKYLNSKFRIIYLVPGVVAVIHLAVAGYDACFIPAYITAGLVAIGFFLEKKILRQVLSICVIVAMLAEFAICNIKVPYNEPTIFNLSISYREADYVAEFEETIDTMREHYVLTEYKDIDFDALYKKYLPSFQEAKKKHDKVGCYIAWLSFCNEFNDGHVAYMDSLTNDEYDEAMERMYGYDYGFSLMRKSDGQIVAVNVEPGSEAEAAGIKNGSVIVEWNGEPVEDMIARFSAPLTRNYPVKESEEFLRVIYAAGQSGETLTVGFINDVADGYGISGDNGTADSKDVAQGNEARGDGVHVEGVQGNGALQVATLDKLGIYRDRLEDTLSKVIDGTLETNLTVRQLNETTAFMRIDGMSYDTQSYGSSDYSKMDEQLRLSLQEQKDAGITNIIIDLRDNTGGDPSFDRTVLKFFFPEGEYVMSYNSVWDYDNNCYKLDETTGGYMLGEPNRLVGEGFWGEGQVIILVSATTVSAGDMFTEVASRLDNVTVMGITPSNCACQAVRGVELKTGAVSFSAVPNLNADGTIYIDTDASREATIPLDVQVEIDDEFIDAVFNRGEDYVVDMALKLIGE